MASSARRMGFGGVDNRIGYLCIRRKIPFNAPQTINRRISKGTDWKGNKSCSRIQDLTVMEGLKEQ